MSLDALISSLVVVMAFATIVLYLYLKKYSEKITYRYFFGNTCGLENNEDLKYLDKIDNITYNNCQTNCTQDPICKSFDFRVLLGAADTTSGLCTLWSQLPLPLRKSGHDHETPKAMEFNGNMCKSVNGKCIETNCKTKLDCPPCHNSHICSEKVIG
jgi:hypothetical protein